MSTSLLATVLRRLVQPVEKTTGQDGELLDRFLSDGDQGAFTALVQRHGPMVLAVSRRVLGNVADTEDAFQATFLVLARKAGQLRKQGALGGWLYRVAYRIALRARAKAARRPPHESWGPNLDDQEQPREAAGTGPVSAAAGKELRAVLDAELNRLPESFRVAIVACDLEGLTNEEAAAQLGWPIGSVKSRLSRGRDLLSARLAGRGLAVAAPLLATALAAGAAETVSLRLVDTTVQAAAAFAAGQEVARTGISVGVAELTQGALRTMLLHKCKLVGGVVAALIAVASLGAIYFPKATHNAAEAADQPPAVFTLPAETPQVKADREAVVKGNTQFALDLYKKLAQDKDYQGKNLFLSPYSISTALAMTYAGARTQTAEEMAQTLHFPVGPDRLHPAFAGLVGRLQANKENKGYQLATANSLWGQKGHPWQKNFLNTTFANYAAGLREMDFRSEDTREAARQAINAWVEEQTKDKIKELLHKDDLNPATRLVLTNAIYFKGDWKDAFDKKLTTDEAFLGTADKQAKAPLMHRTGHYGYMQGEDFQALELPYKGDELSMVVLLPKKADGLADLEKQITTDQLTGWMKRLAKCEVQVSLPKFKTTGRFQLANTLIALGMKSAFGDADFSGMDGERGLKISKVIHQSYVDVNEEGTEAAAATAVVVHFGSDAIHPQPPVFRADHPFVYLIRDQQTGSILFLGRMVEVTK